MSRTAPWIIALVLSVLANGVMLGLMLHRVSDGPQWRAPMSEDAARPHGRHGQGFSTWAFLRALPEDARETAREELEAGRPEMMRHMQAMRAAQIAAAEAIAAEPFNRQAAEAALAQVRAARAAMEAEVEALLIGVVADLPAEDRIRALEAGRRTSHRGGRRHHRGERRHGTPPGE